MDWIKYRTNLTDAPEVIRMAAQLHADAYAITGRLMKLWSWATDHTADGHVVGVTRDWVDCHVHMSGFASAMIAAGWLVESETGLSFPNWDRHLSDGAKSRALATERKRASRICHGDSVTKAGPEKRREEKRRSKDQKTGAASPQLFGESEPEPVQPAELAFPPELDTPAFRAAWDEYVDHRRKSNIKPLKPHSVVGKFAEMAKWGEAAALESIRQSVDNGYAGLFPPKPLQAAGGTRGDPLASARLRRASTAQGEYATPIKVREI
jgi:hypothetical protein